MKIRSLHKTIAFILSVIIFSNTFLLSDTTSVKALPEVTSELKPGELYAKSAVLMDADSGRILYEKSGYEPLANASTTKILTCIIALEMADLNSVVTVSSLAASAPKVKLGLKEGEQYCLMDLLYGLMLESYNDCAVAIAEHIAVTTADFADIMNETALAIGCQDTYFITPNGLDATDENGFHHTTASDLALIMRYCTSISPKAEEFIEITSQRQHSFTDVSKSRYVNAYNLNSFLDMMDGAYSGKTGFTGSAGYCYVGSLKSEGRSYIVALLACGWPNNRTYKWSDAKKLFSYGIENFNLFDLDTLVPDEDLLSPIEAPGSQGESIGEPVSVFLKPVEVATSPENISGKILLAEGEMPEAVYNIPESLNAPVYSGDKIGELSFLLDDTVYKKYDIIASSDARLIDFFWCIRMVFALIIM